LKDYIRSIKMKITLNTVHGLLYNSQKLDISVAVMNDIRSCHDFLDRFRTDKIIYGINTGFGPMAQWRVDEKYLKDLQYNIIRSHSTGAGKPLGDDYVKASMLARLGTFLQCRSGIHPELITLLQNFINHDIIPFIPEHGSVGASGDLVQMAHIALTLIGEGKVHHRGEWKTTREVLDEFNLKPMEIHIREGLAITNGTSVMTGVGAVNQFHAENLLRWAILTSVWMNEIAESYDDFISESLNSCRRHYGQRHIASEMRKISSTSRCLKNREHALYDNDHRDTCVFHEKVQAYYSLRCTPQILGPIYETLENSRRIIEDEFNSASDNPIIDPIERNVFHGGNFHGDYISLEEDKVKIAMVRLTMTAERQLNYLFHDRINNILPPFLNMGKWGLNYGMQACQFTATSTTAESQTLAMPNYVHSIPNNNDNQDIVSMGTNTALLCKHVIENAYQVMAILVMALAQASDCLKITDRLSIQTAEAYRQVRVITPVIVEDTPFYEDIESLINFLKSTK